MPVSPKLDFGETGESGESGENEYILEVTNRLRFAIDGLDTMPSVIIKNHEFAIWEKLDLCFDGILKPCFEAALNKHNLTTELDLTLPKTDQQKSKVFQKGGAICLLSAEQDRNHFIEVDETPTKFCNDIYYQF